MSNNQNNKSISTKPPSYGKIEKLNRFIKHETKDGIYTIKCLNDDSISDFNIIMFITYESYKNGAIYERTYNPDELINLSVIFKLDPDLITDMIIDVPVLEINEQQVSASYTLRIMKKSYTVSMVIPKKEYEGDSKMIDVLHENRAMRRRIKVLECETSNLKDNIKTLSGFVLYSVFDSEGNEDLKYENLKLLLNMGLDFIKPHHSGNNLITTILTMPIKFLNLLFDYGLNPNTLIDKCPIITIIIKRQSKQSTCVEKVERIIKAGADTSILDNDNKCPLDYCISIMESHKIKVEYIQHLQSIKCLLLKNIACKS